MLCQETFQKEAFPVYIFLYSRLLAYINTDGGSDRYRESLYSFVHYRSVKLNLPITSWRRGETVHLAGFKFFMHPLKNMAFFFKNDRGEVVKFPLDIGVLVPTKKGKKILDKVKYIPNIIGNDFLEEHKLALYHSPSKREAYLEQV